MKILFNISLPKVTSLLDAFCVYSLLQAIILSNILPVYVKSLFFLPPISVYLLSTSQSYILGFFLAPFTLLAHLCSN